MVGVKKRDSPAIKPNISMDPTKIDEDYDTAASELWLKPSHELVPVSVVIFGELDILNCSTGFQEEWYFLNAFLIIRLGKVAQSQSSPELGALRKIHIFVVISEAKTPYCHSLTAPPRSHVEVHFVPRVSVGAELGETSGGGVLKL